jgi:hypothetical protein
MTLAQKYLRRIALKQPREAGEGYREEYRIALASIQPLSGAMAAQMYGDRLQEVRLLLTQPETELTVGMGVCVDAQPEDWPDWRVVYVAGWPRHTLAHIRFIPPWERVMRHED